MNSDISRAPILPTLPQLNAAYPYQQKIEGEVTEDDFRSWLEGLPDTMRQAIEREGFDGAKPTLVPPRAGTA